MMMNDDDDDDEQALKHARGVSEQQLRCMLAN